MKKHLIDYLLWFYLKYIKEDWSYLNKIGKIMIYPFWMIKSIMCWVLTPIFIIEYIFVNSKTYKEIEKMNEIFLNEFKF